MLLRRLTCKEPIETKKTKGSCDYITAVHRVKIFLCSLGTQSSRLLSLSTDA